jgi:hypothetical protein
MARRVVVVWAFVALPFAVGSVLIASGATDAFLPHAVFHAVYPIVAAGAIVVLLRFRSWSASNVMRGLVIALIIAQAAVILGHLGEEIAVLRHGAMAAPGSLFTAPDHSMAANVTVPGLLISQLLLIAVTITAGILAWRTRRRLRLRAAPERSPTDAEAGADSIPAG